MSLLWFGADLSKAHTLALKFEHVSLQSWGLSSRTLNALLRYNLKMTVADVILADENFADIQGLGTLGLQELETNISQLVVMDEESAKGNPTLNESPVLNKSAESVPSGRLLPKTLPETTYNSPLIYLHLDLKTHNALMKAGMTTIGQLYDANSSDIGQIKGFHANSLGNINCLLIAMLNILNEEDDVDWLQYWKDQRVQILPSVDASTASSEQNFKLLPKVIREVLFQELDERAWIIIQRRFGLGNVEKLTLEDIAGAYGISRERIRQLEEKALKVLELVFKEQHYTGRSYQVHPKVHQMIQTISSFVEAEESKVILETLLLARVQQVFNVDEKKVASYLFLLLSLLGMERLEFNYSNAIPAWGYIDASKRSMLERGVKHLDDLLTRETALPYPEFDILAQINKGAKKSEKVTLAYLPWLIRLCNSVERREDGSVWGKFECLKGRGNQVERLLVEAGVPLSGAEMAREINHRLVPLGQRPITDTYLTNQLAGDERFIPIGRSGRWSLKSWEHVDTKTILTLMERYLIMLNKPATADEIHTYVSERRQVSKNSIIAYLWGDKDRFTKASPTTWALASWSDADHSNAWNKTQIADFVAALFKKHNTKELDYKIIKEALMEKTGVSASTAQGLLQFNPAIKTRKGKKRDERIVVFQPDYKEILVQPKTYQRHKSLRLQIEASVHNILNIAPSKQIPMAELVRELQKQFDCSEATLYQYIGHMRSIELIDMPNSRRKICRAKEIEGTLTGGTLRDRVSRSARAILETMPGKQMPLADLLLRLRKEYNCPKATLYQYIAHLDCIERVHIPNSTAKLCRIKETLGTQLLQQTQNIANVTLRDNVRSTLFDLTEERVDIGLFRLGREFETTLKTYLIAAYAKGVVKSTPGSLKPDKLKLVDMIKCLKDNGIVTDDAALSYLRQQRNDRAHSGTPSLAERRILMNNVQHLASLYIDYITLLDDLFCKL